MSDFQLVLGDCRAAMRAMKPDSADVCITSPPYYGLRAYDTPPQVWGGSPTCSHEWRLQRWYTEATASRSAGEAFSEAGEDNRERLKRARWREAASCDVCGAWRGELGLEPTPEMYVEHIVSVFREVKRVLRPDGTLWLNIGDSIYSGNGQPRGRDDRSPSRNFSREIVRPIDVGGWAIPKKSLLLIPARVALALQADGWTLRADVIWHRPAAFIEASVSDRPTRKHEHVLMFSRSRRYRYNADTVPDGDVWSINPDRSRYGHNAPFPAELVERCMRASGCPVGGTILDPFAGSGTTGEVAITHGRSFVGIELNEDYVKIAKDRIDETQPGLGVA